MLSVSLRSVVPAAVALGLCGCYAFPTGEAPPETGTEPEATPAPADPVHSLSCAPETSPVEFAWGEPVEVRLDVAAAIDGVPTDPEPLYWSIEDGFGGSIDGDRTYTTPDDHGGRVGFTAQWAGLTASCGLELQLREVDDRTEDAAAESVLDAGLVDDDTCAPVLLDPEPGTALPPNQAAPRFEWTAVDGADIYRLRIESDFATVEVVTPETRWTADFPLLRALHLSAAEQEAFVEVSVAAGTLDPETGLPGGPLCRSTVRTELTVSPHRLHGAVYYWSPSTEGLWRIAFGAEAAEPWVNRESTGYCVGCHAINSANPGRMVMNYGGGNGWAVVSDVSSPETPVRAPEERPGNFSTLSPDGRRMVRSFEGTLYLDDVETGAPLGSLPTSAHATHPDWSPDGTRLVYSSCQSAHHERDWHVRGCSLRVLDVLAGDEFGGDRVLLPRNVNWNYYYPSFSPDSEWVVFNRSTGDAYNDPDAELLLVGADGGVPIRLDAANRGVELANSWPRWGPMSGDRAWLAFASRRARGSTPALHAQVWLAELDLVEAAAGRDPSRPALWLAGQDESVGNHTPVWVPRGE